MHLLEIEAGAGAMNLMKHIKRSIDPKNILNPGKVIDVNSSSDATPQIAAPVTVSNAISPVQQPPLVQDRRDRVD